MVAVKGEGLGGEDDDDMYPRVCVLTFTLQDFSLYQATLHDEMNWEKLSGLSHAQVELSYSGL